MTPRPGTISPWSSKPPILHTTVACMASSALSAVRLIMLKQKRR
ncbi:hypothetical protein HND97_07025 [Vibrio cholerae]|nr:hypothetical protein HND97_07025 [Vibrio cholerae]